VRPTTDTNGLALTLAVTATTATSSHHWLTSATVHALAAAQDLVVCYT
jgi:spore germination protein YaaH